MTAPLSDRLAVTYRIRAADEAEARARADGIAHEQSVEVPPDVVPPGFLRDEIVGRIEAFGPDGDRVWRATISYHPDSAGDDIGQLLNVVFGNSSLQPGLRVEAVEPGPTLRARHAGARQGIAGVRERTGRATGGLIAPVLKPQGLDPAALGRIAALCARGGADVVKEDHGLGDLPFAPFRARVEAVTAALDRVAAETGHRPLYYATLQVPFAQVDAAAAFARDAGVDGLVVMPGLSGFGLLAHLARDGGPGLGLMAHPAFTGAWVTRPDEGIAHGVLYGTLMRLAGADISVFPNVGGRFGFTAADCRAIADACRDAAGPGRPILPSPGGGMSVARAAEMQAMYGEDVVYLIGGSLLRAGDAIPAELRRMRAALGDRSVRAARPGPDLPGPAGGQG